MPDDPTTDDRGQVDLLGQAVTVLFIGQEICWQQQPTPGEHGHKTLLSERTDEARERHRGDMADDRTPLQTEAPMYGQQGVVGDVGMHRVVAQDEMRQDGEDRFTPRTLDASDGETAQPAPAVMGVAGQAPTAATGGLVCKLKTEG